jgi:hypothetical protein
VLGFRGFFPLQSLLNPATMSDVTILAGRYWRVVRVRKPELSF